MQIAKDTVVSLNYRVVDAEGITVDDGTDGMVYLHGGYGGLFERIEAELEGKTTGESIEVRLQPEEAFGEFDAELVSAEPRRLFPDQIEVGMQFERGAPGEEGSDDEDEDDYQLLTITDITEDTVIVDGNHPLAGMTLIFSATVADVRAATDEELAHGHVHAPGGHHH